MQAKTASSENSRSSQYILEIDITDTDTVNVPSVLSQLPISRNRHRFFGFAISRECSQSLGFQGI